MPLYSKYYCGDSALHNVNHYYGMYCGRVCSPVSFIFYRRTPALSQTDYAEVYRKKEEEELMGYTHPHVSITVTLMKYLKIFTT